MTTGIEQRHHWDDRLAAVVAWCEIDHELDGAPLPRLLGYVEDELVVIIDLRPFPSGGFESAFGEAAAAVLGMGCTGVVAAMAGRAWSLDDPIPPVVDMIDFRQRVVTVTAVRRGDPPELVILPFELPDADLRWLPRVGPRRDDSWIGQGLDVAVTTGLGATVDEAADQLARCIRLGHRVAIAEARSGT